ncbi:MAG: flagellar biosynthesis protein FlhF [Peptostreptococcaceae bacterium]|jgi:flagellar biosynthesis protein FlhF|nr:flagellar biosynthesis protein FlhF [Peptostreptococcaceae bacterium]
MQIKKFIGNNVIEAMENVKKEFGENAVILKTKKVKSNGIMGFFKKEKIEILAAMDSSPVKKTNKVKNKDVSNSLKPLTNQKNYEKYNFEKNLDQKMESQKNILQKDLFKDNFSQQNDDSLINSSVDTNFSNFNEKEVQRYDKIKDNTIFKEVHNEKINEDIKELKELVSQMNKKIKIRFEENVDIQNEYKEYFHKLKESGLKENNIIEFIESLDEKIHDEKDFYNKLYDYFKKYVNKFNLDEKINIFIGTTGVGKTTTLAKIASKIVLEKDKRVGFLTLDTYRIAAVDQLRTYAEILNSPIEVAYDDLDVYDAIKRLENRDFVFIDTAGRSHNNQQHMKELEDFMTQIKDIKKNIFLVLSANQTNYDVDKIIEKYSFLENYNIIITKIDETDRLGGILNILKANNISYITHGQNVPDDIQEFDLEEVLNKILLKE